MKRLTEEGQERLKVVLETGRWSLTKQGVAGIRDSVRRALEGKRLQEASLNKIAQALGLAQDWHQHFTETVEGTTRPQVKLQELCDLMKRKTIKAAIRRGIRVHGSISALAREIGVNRSYLYAVAKSIGVEV